MGYISLGLSTKREALKEKRKAIASGFKGVKIIPLKSYGSKRPSRYDVEYESVNPLISKKRKVGKKCITTYFRKTPSGMKRVSSDIRYCP